MEQENLFTPIESKRTFEEISSKVKTLIFDGTLKPGDRLPSELELAKQFGVGRQSVREALRLLELSGFVSIQKGYGGDSQPVSGCVPHGKNHGCRIYVGASGDREGHTR
jgi:DNA-binding transcriptional MocR family regulator